MARTTEFNLHNSIQLSNLLGIGKDYCSDQLGRFFQNKYSLPAVTANKFEIPAKFVTKNEQDSFAICVMMNNHIVDLKYFDDILPDWSNGMNMKHITSEQNLDNINILIDDQRLRPIIQHFKKINDEIVIGQCKGNEFTPL